MPPASKRARKEDSPLELACEWGSCQESFDRMQEFCDHVEGHLKALDIEDGGNYSFGERARGAWITLFSQPLYLRRGVTLCVRDTIHKRGKVKPFILFEIK